MSASPEIPIQTGQPPEFYPKLRVTMKNLPVAFPRDLVAPILALGRETIDPFERLKTFPRFGEEPLSEEHIVRLKERLSIEPMELRQTRRGFRMRADRYCRFLLAVAETTPVPEWMRWRRETA